MGYLRETSEETFVSIINSPLNGNNLASKLGPTVDYKVRGAEKVSRFSMNSKREERVRPVRPVTVRKVLDVLDRPQTAALPPTLKLALHYLRPGVRPVGVTARPAAVAQKVRLRDSG